MKKIIIGLSILVVLAIGMGSVMMGSYNKMVTLSQEVDAQWSVVESKLQRRYDLIPNLVDTVKGTMAHEKEVFKHIADARKAYSSASDRNNKMKASKEMEGALSRLMVVMENYPDLKSGQNVSRLMDELAGTENRISVERDRFNQSVKSYNQYISTLPNALYAKKFGFAEKNYFKANPASENAPKVSFTN